MVSLVCHSRTQVRRHRPHPFIMSPIDTPVLPTSEDARPPQDEPPLKESWWKVHLFRGMVNDVRRRAPYYGSDWVDAWDYRVVPATVYMYFAKYVSLPPCP